MKSKVLPRRVHDTEQEKKHFEKTGVNKRFFRRAVLDAEEDDREGEPYPVCKAGILTFAHFGIGIGVYFLQLIVLSTTCFIGGLLLVAAIYEYSKPSYGVTSSSASSGHPLIASSAACEAAYDVTATGGCEGATSCTATFRPNCELPYNASMADLCMSILMMVAIGISKALENIIVEELDQAVQTAQDYSVVVST
jgi:hypothetical protein